MSAARKVKELDFETGELIRTFNSIQEACDFHDIERPSIYNALVNQKGRMLRKKLRFEYVGEYIIRKVRQLDYDTGEEIEVYNSAEAAAHDNFVDPKRIREALRMQNGCIHSKQLRFEYVEE